MIKLMEYSETREVMELWRQEMTKLSKQEIEVKALLSEVEESMEHANVYVQHKDNEITGFATIVEGFYIADLIGDNESTLTELIKEMQSRYDELQISVHYEESSNNILKQLGFIQFGESEHEIFKHKLLEYEWFSKE